MEIINFVGKIPRNTWVDIAALKDNESTLIRFILPMVAIEADLTGSNAYLHVEGKAPFAIAGNIQPAAGSITLDYTVPAALTAKAGQYRASLQFVRADEAVWCTTDMIWNVLPRTDTSDLVPVEPLPDLVTQVQAAAVYAQNIGIALEAARDAGEFNGLAGPQGAQGAQGGIGPQGPQGLQGVKGDKGDKGDDGIDGRSFMVLALYPTLLALQAAHATGTIGDAYAVGTVSNNNIYIWNTDTSSWENIGALQGPQGETGPKGEKGDTGETGSQGLKGDTGETGSQGPQGEQGPQGVAGADGQSAYAAAQTGGYTDTQGAFYADLAAIDGLSAALAAI